MVLHSVVVEFLTVLEVFVTVLMPVVLLSSVRVILSFSPLGGFMRVKLSVMLLIPWLRIRSSLILLCVLSRGVIRLLGRLHVRFLAVVVAVFVVTLHAI